MQKEFISKSENDTINFGKEFAKNLKKGDTIVLTGDLGAGKTKFVTGILSFYGKENDVSSPTFTIINEYNLKDDLKLFHFDVYRFDFEGEFTAIGGEEYFDKGICIIEWGEKIKNLLPKNYLEVQFSKDENEENVRKIELIPHGDILKGIFLWYYYQLTPLVKH